MLQHREYLALGAARGHEHDEEGEEEKEVGGLEDASASQLYYHLNRSTMHGRDSSRVMDWIKATQQEDADDDQMAQRLDGHDDVQDQQQLPDDDNADGEMAGEVEEEEGQREEKQERQYLGRSSLNYRDFLQNKVKFKKVVDFSQFYYG